VTHGQGFRLPHVNDCTCAGLRYSIALECLQVVQLLDIFLTFYRATYLPNGTLIYTFRDIRLHYTADRFQWDFVAFFPFDFILNMYDATTHRFAGFLRVPRMLSLYTVWFKRGFKLKLGADVSMASAIFQLLAITAIITHIFACTWWFIGSIHMIDVRFTLSSTIVHIGSPLQRSCPHDAAAFIQGSFQAMP
jgi:hypothetical protein